MVLGIKFRRHNLNPELSYTNITGKNAAQYHRSVPPLHYKA